MAVNRRGVPPAIAFPPGWWYITSTHDRGAREHQRAAPGRRLHHRRQNPRGGHPQGSRDPADGRGHSLPADAGFCPRGDQPARADRAGDQPAAQARPAGSPPGPEDLQPARALGRAGHRVSGRRGLRGPRPSRRLHREPGPGAGVDALTAVFRPRETPGAAAGHHQPRSASLAAGGVAAHAATSRRACCRSEEQRLRRFPLPPRGGQEGNSHRCGGPSGWAGPATAFCGRRGRF